MDEDVRSYLRPASIFIPDLPSLPTCRPLGIDSLAAWSRLPDEVIAASGFG